MARYINNKHFHKAMCEYLSEIEETKKNNEELPKVSVYLTQCFMYIAERLGTKPNFRYYTFLDDMKGDGIENAMRYMHNYKPEKSENAFAYFTQIIKNAFIRRIEIEAKEQYVRHKSIFNSGVMNTLVEYQGIDKSFSIDNLGMDFEKSNDIIANFEKKMRDKKNKAAERKNALDNFLLEKEESETTDE